MKNKNFLDINPQFQHALELMEGTKKNVFVTGRAGTGKSTLLQYWRDQTKKNIVVLAPTGVAAVNVNGQTIHSFFRFKPDITVQKIKKLEQQGKDTIYKKLDAIVIDEISMVRADLLDCVDKFLRLNGPDRQLPFGGIQMIMIGDLYQLPPVVAGDERQIFTTHYASPYFFSAQVFSAQQKLIHDQNEFLMELVELGKIYRQKDEDFIELLNAVRNNSATDDQIARINERYQPSFDRDPRDFSILLTTTNLLAAEMNEKELRKLRGELYTHKGEIHGEFDKKYLPTEVDLQVKVGAQVMLLNNDSEGRWSNGTIGKIITIESDPNTQANVFMVKLQGGSVVEVAPYRWDIYQFTYNASARQIESHSIGSFTQYPLKLAWAITIHKSQGKTFDQVVLDIGRGTFSPGQLYVALSRCTSFAGLILKKPIKKQHIWIDWTVVKFMTSFQYRAAAARLSLDEKMKLIESAIAAEEKLAITYLKASDVKSRRLIIPHRVGEMEYMGKSYLGVEAYCCERRGDRVFRVDRILDIEQVEVLI